MPTNDEIIKKRFGLLPEEIKYATTKEIAISKILDMLNEARSEGHKEGQKAEHKRCIDKLKEEVVSWTELAEAEREKPTGIMHDHLEWYVGRIHYTEGLIAKLSEKVD